MKRDKNYIGTHLVMDITTYERESLKWENKVSDYADFEYAHSLKFSPDAVKKVKELIINGFNVNSVLAVVYPSISILNIFSHNLA